ncbi:MFS transporter [Actinopolyspora saharensis]|uniref:Predicted arabinose efflux permease, MFS family n=1 Tax=Actinopolyspora saharensis TaxID=995062 RepID=A0A1H0ZFZ5_9ACTN|nr:Predicted arabinose efflux permease, MFS family [Actinopolyspora saharensis]
MLPASLTTTFRAFRHRNYRRWATADFVSVTGAWMQNLGLSWLVLTMTGSAGLLGLSFLFQALPRVVLGSWAGAVADRWPARRVLFITQTLHAVLALVLAFIAWTHAPVAGIYAIAVLSGVVSVFDGPTLGRFGSQLVSRDDLGNALSIGSVLSSGGRILGMSLAGAVVSLTGEGWLFLINALSFAAVLYAIWRIRSEAMYPLATSEPENSGALFGLRYVLGNKPMIAVFALSFALSSLGRNYQVTMAAMSEGPLGTGAAGYSVLSVVFAVGTIAGGFLAASRRELTLRILLIMALATSVLQFFSGLAPTLLLFAVVLFPIALGAVVIDTTLTTRIQLDSHEEMRGRVLSAKGMVTASAGAFGGPVLGWLSESFTPGHALELAGLVTTVATVAAWIHLARMPERRSMSPEHRWIHLSPTAQLETAPSATEPPAEQRAPEHGEATHLEEAELGEHPRSTRSERNEAVGSTTG